MEVTEIVTFIEGLMVAITAIGTAVLTIHYGAKAFSWIRKAG
ncbi:major capsid protein [Thauera sp. Sel9]|nr:major capsid protein [Thauera sp. Sel9]MCV2216866.1 major capsid protein [Thauera sp. Sel9]